MSATVRLVVRMEDASFAYGRIPVLENVSFSVEAGTALALQGPNGSGKSTVLKAILRQVRVSAGFCECEAWKAADGVAASGIGYVPQTANLDLTFPVTAHEVVQMGLASMLRPFQRLNKQQRLACEEALGRVGLADKVGVRFGNLSGGQRQRVLLARAIVAEPQLLLLDEPFNGLDTTNRDALIRILLQLKKTGMAIIASTHDAALTSQVCEQVLLLGEGQARVQDVAEMQCTTR